MERVIIQVVPLDDVDFAMDVETPATELHTKFGWLGKEYELDLSGEHYDELESALAPFVAAAEKVTPLKKKKQPALQAVRQPEPEDEDAHQRGYFRPGSSKFFEGFRIWALAQDPVPDFELGHKGSKKYYYREPPLYDFFMYLKATGSVGLYLPYLENVMREPPISSSDVAGRVRKAMIRARVHEQLGLSA